MEKPTTVTSIRNISKNKQNRFQKTFNHRACSLHGGLQARPAELDSEASDFQALELRVPSQQGIVFFTKQVAIRTVCASREISQHKASEWDDDPMFCRSIKKQVLGKKIKDLQNCI